MSIEYLKNKISDEIGKLSIVITDYQAGYKQGLLEVLQEIDNIQISPTPTSGIPKVDNINPNHYKGDIECIDAIKSSLFKDAFRGYLKGNIQKYIWRYEEKNGIEDLKKAQWYLNRLIEECSKDK